MIRSRWLVIVGTVGLLTVWPCSGPDADVLDRTIEADMARQQVPGLCFAAVQRGRIVRLGAYGYGNLEWKARTTRETRFEIASVSKMFTGAAVRILVEEGRLDLQAPITRYFDDLPESWSGMRVRHLVTMSTGLPEDWGGDLIPYDADVVTAYDDAAMVRAFTGLKRVAPVGAEFRYSSPGYHLLGLIVSKVSGQALPQFMAERIFTPAGMNHSSFIDNAAVIPERAEGYRRTERTIRKGWHLGQYLHARADVGLLSTAKDMARFLIALRQGRIVKDPAALWEFPVSDTGRSLDYAYGWSDGTLLGRRMVGHGGRYRTGFRSVVDVFPDDDLGVVVLTNGDWVNVDRLALLVIRHVLAGVPDPDADPLPEDDDRQATEATIAALRAVAAGRIDLATMNPDALDPLSLAEAASFLSEVETFSFAGRVAMERPLRMHGHRLVGFTIVRLKLKTKSEPRTLTIYRDELGKIAYVEATQ